MAGLIRASRAEEYHDAAVTLRLLAWKTRSPEIRDDLLRLAVSYERLADWIEGRETIANAAE